MRRARRTISSRSSSVSCRNRVPRSTCSRCVVDEPRSARLQEPDLGPPVDDEPAGHQPLPPPSRHRPGRDVEPPAHRVDRQDRLGRLLGRLADRRRQVLDEQAEVVPDVAARRAPGPGPPSGRIARDPEARGIRTDIASPASISPRSCSARSICSSRRSSGRTAPAAPSVASAPDGDTPLPIPGTPPLRRGTRPASLRAPAAVSPTAPQGPARAVAGRPAVPGRRHLYHLLHVIHVIVTTGVVHRAAYDPSCRRDSKRPCLDSDGAPATDPDLGRPGPSARPVLAITGT